MQRLLVFLAILGSLTPLVYSQSTANKQPEPLSAPKFEVYGLASGIRTIDATGNLLITNTPPSRPLGFTPHGFASGVRTGIVRRYENIGLVADFGFHRYSDHTGSTTIAPFMLGVRAYSNERLRTSFFGEGLAGGYRWTLNSPNLRFATVKGIVSGGGGMDICLTRRLAWRVFEVQFAIAGARQVPLLTSSTSTGLVYRFGAR